jgi:cytochrome c
MNKIIVSIVLVVVLVMGINKLANVVYFVEKPETPSYQIDKTIALADTSAEASAENKQAGDIMALFASVSIEDGAKIFKKCAACHSISKGGANKIGPALYNVIGRKAGSLGGYKYSKAMAAYDKKWSPEEMNGFLIKPKDWIKGTKMAFTGIKDPKQRAAVILYMNINNDNPLELN